jgi:hypothetical protein
MYGSITLSALATLGAHSPGAPAAERREEVATAISAAASTVSPTVSFTNEAVAQTLCSNASTITPVPIAVSTTPTASNTISSSALPLLSQCTAMSPKPIVVHDININHSASSNDLL